MRVYITQNIFSLFLFSCCSYYWGVHYSGVSGRQELTVFEYISQFHLLLRGICSPCQSRGGTFANFPLPGDRAFANPRAITELLTRTRFPIRIITTHRRFYWKKKKTDWLIKNRNKLKRVVKACTRFYACISSLLIKPKLHSEIGAIDVNQRFLVIESNFCWYYLKNILSYL